MTAHDTNLPTTAANSDATATGAVTPANRDTAPVIVWRTTTDEPDAAPDAGVSDSPLTPRLAHHLVAIYSDVHATVVDLDADDHLRHAAETTGRRYLALTSPADLATLTEQPRPAALIVLRWPRPAASVPEQEPNVLLNACQHHLADDGSTIVAVTAATAGQAGTTYTEHEQVLLPAAEAAGLRHLHDIVPLPATDGRDSFTYATAHANTASDRDTDTDTPRQTTNTTLVIFGHPPRRP
jgi:hypothetical protein